MFSKIFPKIKYGTLFLLAMMSFTSVNANAGLILFTDRDEWESAVGTSLDFEGFNSADDILVDYSSGSLKRTSSLISEGERALSVKEGNLLTITFSHEVFAIGFDLNELNTNNLDYFDSAGHEILDALKVTAIWNESTFFGLISDTALTSFSLQGFNTSTNNPVYGLDALAFTSATQVNEPMTAFLMMFSVAGLALARVRKS
ncbi:hypothetical protein ACFSJY_11170 [Thalassotalea euphylliae]|uniref:hypothetical protein n=1 Tax=Thalassotalea euphylliae TaxID=1655234 RepID=UPI003625DEAE